MYLFPDDDIDHPAAPDGLNFGVLSAGDDPDAGNEPLAREEPQHNLHNRLPDFDITITSSARAGLRGIVATAGLHAIAGYRSAVCWEWKRPVSE